MKMQAKQLLQRVGLLDVALRSYHNLKVATPAIVWQEIPLRLRGAPDGHPLPPPDLIFEVIGSRWSAVYLESGARIVADMQEFLEGVGRPLQGFESILDFGCGSGRLIRHVHQYTDAALFGTDYNPRLIEWCRSNLPFGFFSTNLPRPPLGFDAQSFDYIYARSVFTHLTEERQNEWLMEFHRLLKPGGILYFTTHGTRLIAGLSERQREAFFANELVATFTEVEGENLCAVYQTPDHVAQHLTDGYELLISVEGRNREHLYQDVHLLRKTGD